jgi:hypothetical protein
MFQRGQFPKVFGGKSSANKGYPAKSPQAFELPKLFIQESCIPAIPICNLVLAESALAKLFTFSQVIL